MLLQLSGFFKLGALNCCLLMCLKHLRHPGACNILLSPSSDRGNDNWLIKYEKPGEGDESDKVCCVSSNASSWTQLRYSQNKSDYRSSSDICWPISVIN